MCSAACSVASPITQASGIKRERRDDEQRRLVEVEDEPAEDRDRRQGERVPRGSSAPRASLALVVIEAVLFDWNNTLVQFTWDDELLDAGSPRRPRGRERPDVAEFTARYRGLVLER